MNLRFCVFLFLLGAMTVSAQNARPVPTEMKGLKAELVARKTEYRLDSAYRKKGFAKELKKSRGKEPEPPQVYLELVLTNTGDAPVEIRPGSDGQILELTLEGPGAVTHARHVMMTSEFRMGERVVIAPGKKHTIPITRLAFGLRGVSKYAYWTKPGDYKLGALLRLPEPNTGKFVVAKPVALKVVE